MRTRRVYQVGPFRLDATAKVLLKNGEPVHLTLKAVETLLALVENAGEVVTREEIILSVWQGRTVDDANLAQNIAVVRKALAVERGAPGYIETFPGRGYRILGPVEEAGAGKTQRYGQHRKLALALPALIVLAAAIWIWAPRGADSTGEPQRTPVTRLAGREYQAALSPDGRKVAFVWQEEGAASAGIWVQETGESTPRPIARDAARYSSPAWSPDGRRLAYLRFDESSGSIIVTSPDDGAQRTVTDVSPSIHGLPQRRLDWSPDGDTLAVDDVAPGRHAFGIFLVSLATGVKKPLAWPGDDAIGDLDPRFSPDGRTVSFIRAFYRGRQELFTAPVSGGQPRQLTDDGQEVSDQDWMPDGRSLVFGSNRGGDFRLWRIGYPLATQRQIQRTTIYNDWPLQVSISRHAPVLVYSALRDDLHIWRLDLSAGSRAGNSWKRVIASSGRDASPQYSPQGDRIAFRSDRSGDEQLWVCDSDGGNPVQITRGNVRPSVGRWSPDGQSVVFNDAPSGRIYLARRGADGVWTVSSAGANGYHPVFSPDAKWIYAGTMNSLVRMPAAGGPATPISAVRGISLGISADGRYLYFVREPASAELWRLDTGTGRTEKVLDGLAPYCSSCWALTRRGIYYLGVKPRLPDRQVLYFRDFATGRDRPLEDYPEALSPIGSGPFSLSPDGRYLLCVRVRMGNADIFRVEPFR